MFWCCLEHVAQLALCVVNGLRVLSCSDSHERISSWESPFLVRYRVMMLKILGEVTIYFRGRPSSVGVVLLYFTENVFGIIKVFSPYGKRFSRWGSVQIVQAMRKNRGNNLFPFAKTVMCCLNDTPICVYDLGQFFVRRLLTSERADGAVRIVERITGHSSSGLLPS